jgi:hypothetical protein
MIEQKGMTDAEVIHRVNTFDFGQAPSTRRYRIQHDETSE